ncbi:hypothetical protein AALP_AA6G068300 [Arabis alpina]|uniref:Rapid alkalinization factor 1 n=1 Tax=Arabis alpina TaxID=50452 RepID=A0A087GMK0_ARAAL|nr:hypothetical protein AALP_AA6G068300 [Arabis alpina]
MAISKKTMVLSLALIIVIVCNVMSTTEAKVIGNGAMETDDCVGPKCKTMTPANPYKRGCESAERCRSG